MTTETWPGAVTVFVSHTTPVSKLMELLAKKTGCGMGNLDVPWKTLDSRLLAPPEPSAEMKMGLLADGKDMSSPEALLLAEQKSARAATVRELLMFLWTFPEEQLNYPIVALGEPDAVDGPIVAYSYVVGGARMVFIGKPSETCKWEAGCRFLVVPV